MFILILGITIGPAQKIPTNHLETEFESWESGDCSIRQAQWSRNEWDNGFE